MSIKEGLFDTIGRTIKEIIINDSCPSSPDFHLFLVFEDGGAYEFYGDGFLSSSSDVGGGLEYAKVFRRCKIKRYYLDDQGRKVIEDITV